MIDTTTVAGTSHRNGDLNHTTTRRCYMKTRKFSILAIAIIAGLMISGIGFVSTQAGEEYSFKLHNSTTSTIKSILVSQDKKEWGEFDIGSGIKAGATVELAWDKSTNSEACKQFVKAVFADGSESAPSKFDFCESDLQLEF